MGNTRATMKIEIFKGGGMKKIKKIERAIMIIIIILVFLLLLIYINHRIRLKKESALRSPLGQIVEVDGHNMSVYIEGEGETTLVFMSGGGTCCPILDFKSLYSLLSDNYKVAVVEKFGYGFSDVVDPDEVSAIIGLDMAVPRYYDSMRINIPMMRIASWAAKIGITRFIPRIAESDAIKYGTLSDSEKEILAVFYTHTATVTMINECDSVTENAKLVESMGVPQLPMLLFISNGSGGTGFDEETWRKIPIEYISQVQNGKYIELDCPHYIHNYEYDAISGNIIEFLSE